METFTLIFGPRGRDPMGVFWEKLRFDFAKIFGGGSLSSRN